MTSVVFFIQSFVATQKILTSTYDVHSFSSLSLFVTIIPDIYGNISSPSIIV
jgi:hypothetical protein